MRQRLEFRGTWADLFGTSLVIAFLSAITFGIYVPWGVARWRRTVLEHTYLDDEPLRFDGTGGELFGILLKVAFFTLITLGIYGFLCYPMVAVAKWDTAHTILPGGKRLEYKGTALDLFGDVLVVLLLTTITLGIYSFWGYARIRRHILSHTHVDGRPLEFTGTGGQYLGIVLTNAILSTITVGIYALLGAAAARQLKWDCESTLVSYARGQLGIGAISGDGGRPIQVTVNVNQP